MTRRLLPLLLLALLLLGHPTAVRAVGNCGVYESYSANQVLTASSLNNNLTQAATTNSTLACVDDTSGTLAAMRTTVDPTGESLATSAEGEIHRLRFMIGLITGGGRWYSNPSPLVPPGDIHAGIAGSRSAGIVLFHSSSSFRTGLYAGTATAAADYFMPTGPGTAGQVLTWNAGNQLSWTTGGGDVTEMGENTTEATTTSTTITNILTISTTSIAVNRPFWFACNLRKSAGAATSATVGLMLNATVVRSGITWSDSANGANSGSIWGYVAAQTANYLRAGFLIVAGLGAPSASGAVYLFDSDMPNAAITSIIIRGNVGDAAVTMGVDDCKAWAGNTY